MALQNKGVKNSNNKPPNARKAASQTRTKFLVYRFIVVKIQNNLYNFKWRSLAL
jgi:hypothetical protein